MPDTVVRQCAIAKQTIKAHVGEFEDLLAERLKARGLQFIPQAAVDRYNVDLALPPFAVEIHNDTHHPSRRTRLASRIEHLLDLGWHVIYVWHYPTVMHRADRKGTWGGPFDFDFVTDQIITMVNELGSDPAAPRQYRVICSDGKDPTSRRTKFNHLADVPPSSHH